MTESTNDIDQAERIRRLQERRAASGKSRAAVTRSTVAAANPARGASPARQRARRRHPAKGTRILLTGLSVASFFGIGGSLLVASNNATTVLQTATPVVTSAASTGAVSATPATASTGSHAPVVAHTTTRGS
jgi:hypothetical protein